MALAHPVIGLSLHCRGFGNGVVEERKRPLAWGGGAVSFAGKGSGGDVEEISSGARSGSGRRYVSGSARLRVAEASTVERGQTRSTVEIPVTCYQILGVSEKAEKDEIVKAAMELKNTEIEDGYTTGVNVSRQDLLMDVRDKLLFEPEYAGNIKEKVPPRSSLFIPWNWLPSALCLLQEVGEEKLVLEIGRSALQLSDSKPYVHDLLLSMALAECSIAKGGFEKSKISEGFEALARAQYLLRSNTSLGKMPLLAQIEETLEEFAPSCTLELLSMAHTPDNAERRRGAIAALQELLRQGLGVESSCRVQDWPSFLSQAMNKLMATEIVDLLSWDNLAIVRKNKKSMESQNQRIIVDCNCFYRAMIAHIAFGFSTRQMEMITKAQTICECLISSDNMDLKFEESFCMFLLGQEAGAVTVEKLRKLAVNGCSDSQISALAKSKEKNDKDVVNHSLEMWLKDAVLSLFADTRDCSPSLASFFRGPKRILDGSKQKSGVARTITSSTYQSSSYNVLTGGKNSGDQASPLNSIRHLGEAVRQLAPPSLDVQSALNKSSGSANSSSVQLKRSPGLHHINTWQNWCMTGDMAVKVAYSTLAGCVLFGAFKLLNMQFGYSKFTNNWKASHLKRETDVVTLTKNFPSASGGTSSLNSRDIFSQLRKLMTMYKKDHKHYPSNERTPHNHWPADNISSSVGVTGDVLHRRQMALEEAEELVKQWQDIKAEALGPSHRVHMLSEFLDESMLSQWQELANSAKAQSCFWRFVLLQLSIVRAEILSDGVGDEMAEIEAVLEEAAELVEESQPRNPSYYSTYKVHYTLKRQDDSSWRICGGVIQNLQ
ncbi:plastid division protein CDP1, chloroplastic isoform X1 [Typha angustifolia]|uniref:plastid division protein CDP1, chloroplastic isoform X1 n=1 Tax=Typha angustifolia TaxID=59011 RepID=UPI003C3032F1